MKRCSVKGCADKHMARGYCQHHYDGMRRAGGADKIKRKTRNGAHREFIDQAASYTGDACLIWPYGVGASGYGHIHVQRKQSSAHRVVCELAHGSPPFHDAEAAHSCHTPRCCNPSHLRWATPQQNADDRMKRGTVPRGSSLRWAKLTEADVLEILGLLPTMTHQEIADRFGVCRPNISRIASGRTWSWLTGLTRGGDQNRAEQSV